MTRELTTAASYLLPRVFCAYPPLFFPSFVLYTARWIDLAYTPLPH